MQLAVDLLMGLLWWLLGSMVLLVVSCWCFDSGVECRGVQAMCLASLASLSACSGAMTAVNGSTWSHASSVHGTSRAEGSRGLLLCGSWPS
jgi:hypothetical protein